MKRVLSVVCVLVLMLCAFPLSIVSAATGTQEDPIEIQANDTIETDGSGNVVYYVYNAPASGEYTVTITGSKGVDSFGTSAVHPMTGFPMETWAMNGVLNTTMMAQMWTMNQIVLPIFDWEAQTLTISIEIAKGTWGAPDTLVIGENTAKNPDNDYYYYEWTAPSNGKLTITMPEENWAYNGYVTNPATDVCTYFADWDMTSVDGTNPFTVKVKEGHVVTVMVQTLPDANNWDAVYAGEVTFTAAFEEAAPADGSQENPFEIQANDTIETDGSGNVVYYVYSVPTPADYVVTITGSMGVDSFGTSMTHPMTGFPMENWAMNGVLTTTVSAQSEIVLPIFDWEAETLTITIEEAKGTWSSPETLVIGENTAKNPDNDYFYYTWTAPADGALTFTMPEENWAYNGYVTNYDTWETTYFADWDMTSADDTVTNPFTVNVKEGEEVSVMVQTLPDKENWDAVYAGEVTFTAAFEEGSVEGGDRTPEELVIGETTVTSADGKDYEYIWFADQNGTFSFMVNEDRCSAGWTYKILFNGEVVAEYDSNDGRNSADFAMDVFTGDVVKISVNNIANAAGETVAFTTEFVPEIVEENYAMGESLVLGDNTYALVPGYEYTVLPFCPTEDGVYTFTAADGVMGIASTNGMWVTTEPSAETVADATFEWECTGVGQEIWVAVTGDTNSVAIEVTRRDRETGEETPWTIYENTTAPTPFTYDGDFEAMDYVDTFDETVDEAVLGEDGYYHLNDANGPVLYVKIDDQLMPLADIIAYGQMRVDFFEEDGTHVKVDYNDAAQAYVDAMDETSGLYPLTADLMEMYQVVGAAKFWYGENGFVGGDLADAWMFACYYDADAATVVPDEDDDTQTSTPDKEDDAQTPAPEKSPQTGDASHAVMFFVVAVLAMAVVLVTVKAKKVNG